MPTLHKLKITLGILDSAIIGLVYFSFDLSGIHLSLFDHWSKDFVGILRTHLKHLISSIFKALPFLFCFGFDMGRFALFDLLVQEVSSLLHSSFKVSANSSEDGVEKFARSSDGLLDVIWIVNLLLLQIRTVSLYGLFYFWLLDGFGI